MSLRVVLGGVGLKPFVPGWNERFLSFVNALMCSTRLESVLLCWLLTILTNRKGRGVFSERVGAVIPTLSSLYTREDFFKTRGFAGGSHFPAKIGAHQYYD